MSWNQKFIELGPVVFFLIYQKGKYFVWNPQYTAFWRARYCYCWKNLTDIKFHIYVYESLNWPLLFGLLTVNKSSSVLKRRSIKSRMGFRGAYLTFKILQDRIFFRSAKPRSEQKPWKNKIHFRRGCLKNCFTWLKDLFRKSVLNHTSFWGRLWYFTRFGTALITFVYKTNLKMR